MADEAIIEVIDPDLEVLMERFFANSLEEVEDMRNALRSSDYDTLIRLGHTAKGTGHGYGFKGMGEIGLALEEAAKVHNNAECQNRIEQMAHYLAHVKVEFGS